MDGDRPAPRPAAPACSGLVRLVWRRDSDDHPISLDGEHVAEARLPDLAVSTGMDPEPHTLAELHRGAHDPAVRSLCAQHGADYHPDDRRRRPDVVAVRVWLRTHAVPWARLHLHGRLERDHDPVCGAADPALYHVSVSGLDRYLPAAVGA